MHGPPLLCLWVAPVLMQHVVADPIDVTTTSPIANASKIAPSANHIWLPRPEAELSPNAYGSVVSSFNLRASVRFRPISKGRGPYAICGVGGGAAPLQCVGILHRIHSP